jgi:hypothetical protein
MSKKELFKDYKARKYQSLTIQTGFFYILVTNHHQKQNYEMSAVPTGKKNIILSYLGQSDKLQQLH